MPEIIHCPCQLRGPEEGHLLLESFEELRKKCSALQQILVPDDEWLDFQKWARETDEAGHRYIVLGALQNGFLPRLTLPIHRYLLKDDLPHPKLIKQYRKDLVERWMSESTPLERHGKSRKYQGKLVELLIAAWMEERGWKIDNLAALGSNFDIECRGTEGVACAIEVKLIGYDDEIFEKVMECAQAGNPLRGSLNLYGEFNFVLLKAYEAAKQLAAANKRRIALVVISNMKWDFLEQPIKDEWLRQRPFHFSEFASPRWGNILKSKKDESKKFISIEDDLDTIVGQLDELWIVREHDGLEYSLELALKL